MYQQEVNADVNQKTNNMITPTVKEVIRKLSKIEINLNPKTTLLLEFEPEDNDVYNATVKGPKPFPNGENPINSMCEEAWSWIVNSDEDEFETTVKMLLEIRKIVRNASL